MEALTTALKAFVIATGVVLLVGVVLLGVLLYQRGEADRAAGLPPPPAEEIAPIVLPAGARIEEVVPDGRRLVLLAVDPAGRQYLAVVDPLTGARLSLVPVVPEP